VAARGKGREVAWRTTRSRPGARSLRDPLHHALGQQRRRVALACHTTASAPPGSVQIPDRVRHGLRGHAA
jgi:hypothetical protein